MRCPVEGNPRTSGKERAGARDGTRESKGRTNVRTYRHTGRRVSGQEAHGLPAIIMRNRGGPSAVGGPGWPFRFQARAWADRERLSRRRER